MPMQRWMARAEGGISQRLKPGPAMVRSRARKPGALSTPVADILCLPPNKNWSAVYERYGVPNSRGNLSLGRKVGRSILQVQADTPEARRPAIRIETRVTDELKIGTELHFHRCPGNGIC